VPSSPTSVGVVLSAQALALTTNNPFGLAASNGVRILVGQGY
jgi:hypothetical protein